MARSAQMLYRVPKIYEDSNLSSPKVLNKYGRSSLRLFFPLEAKALRTPFRAYVLQTIYQIAHEELRDSLKSAVVSTWIDPEEPVDPILLLTIVADADWTKLRNARDVILSAIAEEASSWTEAQKEDYSKTIYFDVEPLNV